VTDDRERTADLELVRAAKAGDRGAIEQVVERMRCIPRMLASKNVQHGRPLSAEDLADLGQQVFATVWQKCDEYLGDARLESWLYPFCAMGFMNVLRARTRTAVGLSDEGRSLADRDDAGALAEELDYIHVHAVLREIPREEALVIELKQFHDLTFDQIAARLSISPNTAKSRYYRGLEGMRERLARRFGEEHA
jgi:RNA polymerase sigma-70 factor (ECF subfamily)